MGTNCDFVLWRKVEVYFKRSVPCLANIHKHNPPQRQKQRLLFLIAILCCLLFPANAFAHPLGEFVVNRYSRLEPGAEQIQLLYVVDMAEILYWSAT